MQGDVYRRMSRVGEEGAIVERKTGVGVAKDESGDAATLEFLAKQAGNRERHIFFHECGTEGLAAVRTTVAGVDHCEVPAWSV